MVFQAYHYVHPLEMGLWGRVRQTYRQGEGFNVFLFFSVPPVCKAHNFVSPDAIAALSPFVYPSAFAK